MQRNRLLIFAILAVFAAGLDLWTKSIAFERLGLPGASDPYWLIDGTFGFQTSVNLGAVFGIGQGRGGLFAAFSVVAFVGIVIWMAKFGGTDSLWLTIALGLVTGGIFGNLYDRLGMWWIEGYPEAWQSGVRDFILFRLQGVPFFDPWPNFNLADACLVTGATMLVIHSYRVPATESQAGVTEEANGDR